MSVHNEHTIQALVTAIISRLAERLGADGKKGTVLTVFSGATVGLPQALEQLRHLLLAGFRIEAAYSPQARMLYGHTVNEQLAGFPHVQELDEQQWYASLTTAEVVLVPMLSLNTASKVSLLIADSLPTNLIIHALSLGKPVVVATNGADPTDRHWARRSPGCQVSPHFQHLAVERLQTLAKLGCECVDVAALASRLSHNQAQPAVPAASGLSAPVPTQTKETISFTGQIVAAAHVRNAHSRGANLGLRPGTVVTPLAREIAGQLQIRLIQHT